MLFDYFAGVKITRIPYKGAAPAMTAIMSRGARHVSDRRLRGPARAVGTVACDRSWQRAPVRFRPRAADDRCVGRSWYDADFLSAVFAPAGTPTAIVSRLNREIARYLQSADGREAFLNAGSEAAPSTPEDLTATIKSEMTTYGKVLKAAGATGP